MIKRRLVRERGRYGINHEQFTVLLETYKKYVFAIIYSITHDNQEVEAIAQDVFMKVYARPPTEDSDAGTKAYIGRIAANTAIDFNRKRRSLVRIDDAATDMASGYDMEEHVISRMEAEQLRKIVNKLPEVYRTVIKLFYFEGLSYKEIADKEGTALKTVESRLYRAKKLLSAVLKER